MVRIWGRIVGRIASDDADLSPEGAFARMAMASVAGLFGPAMLTLPKEHLSWQVFGCLALLAPIVAIARAAKRRSYGFPAVLGYLIAGLGIAIAYGAQPLAFADWLILTPIEAAIILAAAAADFGPVSPFLVSLGLAIVERVAIGGVSSDAGVALIFAPPAAVSVALAARGLDRALRAQRRREWLRSQGAPSSSEMYVWLDGHGRVKEIGADLVEAFQVDAERVAGRSFLKLVALADRAQFAQAFRSALQGDATEVVTVKVNFSDVGKPGGDGREIWFEGRLRRLVGGGGPFGAAVAVALKDVSEAKEAEKRLETLRREATSALSMKDQMLANVSHELRTPLNAILGFSEMLADPRLAPASSEQRQDYARIINSSASHLLSVVNLLLDMSKLEAGRYDIEPEPFEVWPMIRGCVDMVRLKAESSGVAIDVSAVRPRLELNADPRAFRQVVLNLLSNAIKFTPKDGQVSIEADVAGDVLEIAVADTGIGISAEHLPRLGDPFFQAHSGYDRNADGAGLGLALVRGLVGLHGGSVAIESSPGVGTRVTVRLPLDGEAAPRVGPLLTPKFEVLPRMNRRPATPDWLAIEERKIA